MIKVVLVDEDTGVETFCSEVGPEDAWWSVPLPPCPSCQGEVVWAEVGRVPGTRRCVDCRQFYHLQTIASEISKMAFLPTFQRCIVCGGPVSKLDAIFGPSCPDCTAKGDKR